MKLSLQNLVLCPQCGVVQFQSRALLHRLIKLELHGLRLNFFLLSGSQGSIPIFLFT